MGCDGRVGSRAKKDMCSVCNGDNSTCVKVAALAFPNADAFVLKTRNPQRCIMTWFVCSSRYNCITKCVLSIIKWRKCTATAHLSAYPKAPHTSGSATTAATTSVGFEAHVGELCVEMLQMLMLRIRSTDGRRRAVFPERQLGHRLARPFRVQILRRRL